MGVGCAADHEYGGAREEGGAEEDRRQSGGTGSTRFVGNVELKRQETMQAAASPRKDAFAGPSGCEDAASRGSGSLDRVTDSVWSAAGRRASNEGDGGAFCRWQLDASKRSCHDDLKQ